VIAEIATGLLLAGITAAPAFAAVSGQWRPTGSMLEGRYQFTQTLLPNGTVLVAGGIGPDGNATAEAEIYDPTSGTWSQTGSMHVARNAPSATLLPNGKVLVAGGNTCACGTPSGVTATAELYDPASGTWSLTGSMAVARNDHTATLLPDGKVLVAGGDNESATFASAELYDPATGTWSPTGSMTTPRSGQTATLLPDGKVLAAGGLSDVTSAIAVASAELYDPTTGTWSPTGSMLTARFLHTANLLPIGQVLVAGGAPSVLVPFTSTFQSVASAELYDPATGTWTETGSMHDARTTQAATPLPNGDVLVAGGINGRGRTVLRSAEIYDTSSGTWSSTTPMMQSRFDPQMTLLPDGTVLVDGGVTFSSNLHGFGHGTFPLSAELFTP
jgi:Galactose oxidase, central domain/Kelch motif